MFHLTLWAFASAFSVFAAEPDSEIEEFKRRMKEGATLRMEGVRESMLEANGVRYRQYEIGNQVFVVRIRAPIDANPVYRAPTPQVTCFGEPEPRISGAVDSVKRPT